MSPQTHRDRTLLVDILILSGLWIIMALIAKPIGNFPLNDDWVYGISVRELVEQGRLFFLTEWACKTLVSHVLWGSLFCLPAGFSYTALRISQLAAGLIGIIFLYGFCRELKIPRWMAFFTAAALAVNPVYFELSNTFMTDVFFTTGCCLSVVLLIKGTEQNNRRILALGWLATVLTVFTRELAVIIPVGYGAACVLHRGMNLRNVIKSFIPAAAIFGLLVIHQLWLYPAFGFPNLLNPRSTGAVAPLVASPVRFVYDVATRLVILYVYLGLFLLPVFLLFKPVSASAFTAVQRRVLIGSTVLFGVAASALLIFDLGLMPIGRNVLYDFGLGPPVLRDVYLLHLPNLARAPQWFWLIITLIGLIGAVYLCWITVAVILRIIKRTTSPAKSHADWLMAFLFSVAVLYTIPVVARGFFDRYLLLYVPWIAGLLWILRPQIPSPNRWRYVSAGVVLAVFAVFAAFATHDYLSWNRARWQAVDYLTKDLQIPMREIDGGYEVNSTFLFRPDYVKTTVKSWWFVEDDTYLVSFGLVPGYDRLKRFGYPSYLQSDTAAICVLKRIAPPVSSTGGGTEP